MVKEITKAEDLVIRIETLQNLLTVCTSQRFKYAVDVYGFIADCITDSQREISEEDEETQ